MTSHKGTKIIDGSSGLFCSPAGHCHPKIIEAVHNQLKKNTYTSPFGMGHPASFALADKVSELTPEDMNHVFFVNSGSEAIDTALKMHDHYLRQQCWDRSHDTPSRKIKTSALLDDRPRKNARAQASNWSQTRAGSMQSKAISEKAWHTSGTCKAVKLSANAKGAKKHFERT